MRYAKRLAAIAPETKLVRKNLSEFGLDLVSGFAEEVDSEAEFIHQIASTILKQYSSRRTSGRDHHLVYLAEKIRSITSRRHYPELADLVQAVRLHYDPDSAKVDTPESIRDLIRNNQPVDLVYVSELRRLVKNPHLTNPRKKK